MTCTGWLALGLLMVASTASAGTTALPVGNGAQLVFSYPDSWAARISDSKLGPTVTFLPKDGDQFVMLVSATPRPDGFPRNEEELQASVRLRGEERLPTSVQNKVVLLRVRGKQTTGFLYHLTQRDKEQGPGDFRELHQGSLVVGTHLLTATILTHSGDVKTISAGFSMLSGVVRRP